MRKLTLKCECGQLMRVPRNAIGKRGLCPSCGQAVLITRNGGVSTNKQKRANDNEGWTKKKSWWQGKNEPSESAKQKFGEAVDLYCGSRYAEALAVFELLAKEYPNNPDIVQGQRQCVRAMRRSTLPGAVSKGTTDRSRMLTGATDLDKNTVKRVLLDKMLNAQNENIQLQATELAARLLGMFDNEKETETENANGNGRVKTDSEDIANETNKETADDLSSGDLLNNG